jgi:hypothetical protein
VQTLLSWHWELALPGSRASLPGQPKLTQHGRDLTVSPTPYTRRAGPAPGHPTTAPTAVSRGRWSMSPPSVSESRIRRSAGEPLVCPSSRVACLSTISTASWALPSGETYLPCLPPFIDRSLLLPRPDHGASFGSSHTHVNARLADLGIGGVRRPKAGEPDRDPIAAHAPREPGDRQKYGPGGHG